MFARGILFGKMMLELGDSTAVTCPATHYSCDIEWKTKGWISGGYNAIAGHVRGPEGSAGEITGHWDGLMEFKDKGGKKQTLFDATRAQVRPKTVLPEEQQEANESRRSVSAITFGTALQGPSLTVVYLAGNGQTMGRLNSCYQGV